MSKEALAKVVQRAISDAGFRRQLSSDPAGALRGFDLTSDEMSALRTGDAGRLTTLGIDQRMSKAFTLGGAVAATRMAQSDLSAAGSAAIDDGGSAGTIIPHDPESAQTADAAGGASTRSAINDDPDGFLAANAQSARTGDDWKYADRASAQGNAAAIEGSPEATAAELARIDDGASGSVSRINDDPDGFLSAANARADSSGAASGETTAFSDESEAYLTKVGYDSSARAVSADSSGGTSASAEGTAYLDDSESYLSRIGYDSSAAETAVSDAHDRGDDMASPTAIADDEASGGSGTSEGGPNISH